MQTVIYNPTHGQPILGQAEKPCVLMFSVENEDGTYSHKVIRPGIQALEAELPAIISENPDIMIVHKEVLSSSDLTAQQAAFAIQGQHDLEVLKEFGAKEARATVLKAINVRMVQLQQEIDTAKARENG